MLFIAHWGTNKLLRRHLLAKTDSDLYYASFTWLRFFRCYTYMKIPVFKSLSNLKIYISNKHIFSFVTEKRLFVMRREKKTINNMMILDIWNSYIALRWRDEIKRSSQLRTPLKRVVKYESNSWLVSSVGRALHRCRRGHRFKSRTGLKVFFQVLFSTTRFSSVLICEDLFISYTKYFFK